MKKAAEGGVPADSSVPPSPPEAPAMAAGVHKRNDGLWVARVYSVEPSGKAKLVKESTPDLRAMAIERMQIWAADLFLA